eukprot:scaffold9684_cov57-Phaeocystis_antarctica.AAC.1
MWAAYNLARSCRPAQPGVLHFEQSALQLPQPLVLSRQQRAVPVRHEGRTRAVVESTRPPPARRPAQIASPQSRRGDARPPPARSPG